MTDDEKIDAFELHVRDRQLLIAKHLSQHFVDDIPGDPLSQSAFAILSIVTNYFEMIEQFRIGQSSKGRSAEFFRNGVERVFPQSQVSAADADRLYSFMRCGMYHSAMPTDRCGLSRELSKPIVNDNGVILVNPALLVDALISHFKEYCEKLRDPCCTTERANMLLLFGLLATKAQTSMYTATQTQTTTTAPPWQY